LGGSFWRDKRGYSLTPDAVAGLENLRSAFHHLSVAVDAIASGGHRVLTVSAVPSLSAEWLVPRLHRFREKYPDIDVLLHPSEELVQLERSRVDVGIRRQHYDPSDDRLASLVLGNKMETVANLPT
jgi:LysR family transcriptional regulator, glycine cleavage system transcriptional activator